MATGGSHVYHHKVESGSRDFCCWMARTPVRGREWRRERSGSAGFRSSSERGWVALMPPPHRGKLPLQVFSESDPEGMTGASGRLVVVSRRARGGEPRQSKKLRRRPNSAG